MKVPSPSEIYNKKPDWIAKSSPPPPPPKEDFESYYIKRVTAEFADDIDKLRNAPDFSEASVPVLIEALKETSRGFSEKEKEMVMKGEGKSGVATFF